MVWITDGTTTTFSATVTENYSKTSNQSDTGIQHYYGRIQNKAQISSMVMLLLNLLSISYELMSYMWPLYGGWLIYQRCHFQMFIYSFISWNCFILVRIMVAADPISETLGSIQEYTLDETFDESIALVNNKINK